MSAGRKPKPTDINVRLVAPPTEFSVDFVQGMADRMSVSFYKYGAMASADIDVRATIAMRLDRYAETGNTEWLIDVANFALIGFVHPTHTDAHYAATDSDQSPGRVDTIGNVSADRNT